MFSAPELKAQIARSGYTQERLAAKIGITPKTLYTKMKTGRFGTDEVELIMDALDIRDPVPIFFAEE